MRRFALILLFLPAVAFGQATITVTPGTSYQTWRSVGGGDGPRNPKIPITGPGCATSETVSGSTVTAVHNFMISELNLNRMRFNIAHAQAIESASNDNTDPNNTVQSTFDTTMTTPYNYGSGCTETSDDWLTRMKTWRDAVIAAGLTPDVQLEFFFYQDLSSMPAWWQTGSPNSTGCGVDEAGEVVNAVINHIHTNFGFYPDIAGWNEPTTGGSLLQAEPSTYTGASCTKPADWMGGEIKSLQTRLTNAGITTKIIAPEPAQGSDDAVTDLNAINLVAGAEADIAQIGYHGYGTNSNAQLQGIATRASADNAITAMTETIIQTGVSGHFGNDYLSGLNALAQSQASIFTNAIQANISSYSFNAGDFVRCGSAGCPEVASGGTGAWGIDIDPTDPTLWYVMPEAYVLRQFTKYVHTGDVRVSATSNDSNTYVTTWQRTVSGTPYYTAIIANANNVSENITINGLPDGNYAAHKLDPTKCVTTGQYRCTPDDSGTVTVAANTVTLTSVPTNAVWTIVQSQTISVGVSPASATVVNGAVQQFTATVTGDSLNQGVTWALSGAGCSGSTCGTLSASSSASGTPITYTAPPAVPSPATVTLTATSVTDGTKTDAATITVTTNADAFGGDTKQPCVASPSNWRTFEKHNVTWWWCTPVTASSPVNAASHRLFFEGIGNDSFYNPASKYGTNANACAEAINEEAGWNFNGIGQKSYTVGIEGTCGTRPQIQTFEILSRSFYNGSGYAPAGTYEKSLTKMVNANGTPDFLKPLMDVFDPALYTYMDDYMKSSPNVNNFDLYKSSNYSAGFMIGDVDNFVGGGTSGDFDATFLGNAHNESDPTRIVFTSSPLMTFNPDLTNGFTTTTPGLYSDTKNYSKTAMASPPSTCVVATPCGLRDYLAKKYVTIGALNTAWSAPSQTQQWNTSQSTNTGGAGSTRATPTSATSTGMSWTLTVSEVWASAGVAIKPSGGSAPMADNSGATVNTCNGVSTCTLSGFTIGSGSNRLLLVGVAYRSGGGTTTVSGVTFGGVALTHACAATCKIEGNDNRAVDVWYLTTPATSTANIVVTFSSNTTGGIVVGADSWTGVNQTTPLGLVSVNNGNSTSPSITVTAGANDLSHDFITWVGGTVSTAAVQSVSNPNYTTFDSSGTVRTAVTICGSVTWTGSNTQCVDNTSLAGLTNISPLSVQITVDGTVQAGDCPWFEGNGQGHTLNYCGSLSVNTGYLGGAASNTIASTSTIGYTTGAVTLNFKSAPSAGAHTITATFVQNGWMYGTGLMDEDGSHVVWAGTNRVCLLPVNGGGAGTDSWACRTGNPGNYTQPDMNPTLAADLEAWLQQFSSEFYSNSQTKAHADAANMAFMGLDAFGTWMQPPNKNLLIGASGYIDLAFPELGWSPDEGVSCGCTTQSAYNTAVNYFTQYYGDHPILNFLELNANPDSAMAGNPASGVLTYNSQGNRGQGYYNIINAMLTTLSANGTIQWVGASWWSRQDITGELTNWGLKSVTDNAYDGVEPAAGTVSCSAPLQAYNCGSEPATSATRPYGNAISNISTANTLWFSQSQPSIPILAPATTVMMLVKNYRRTEDEIYDSRKVVSDSGDWLVSRIGSRRGTNPTRYSTLLDGNQ